MTTTNGLDPERLIRELHTLAEVAKSLTAPNDLPNLLRAALDKLAQVFEPAELGVVMLWDAASGLFRTEAALGYSLDIMRDFCLRQGESITGKVYDTGTACLLKEPTQVTDMICDMRPANRAVLAHALGTDALPHSALAVPLRAGDRRFGVLVLEMLHRPAKFTERDVSFVQTIADLIALAVDRTRLEEEAEAVRDAQQADRLRSEVMATLSHELRTPLAAIKGYSTAMLIDEVEWPEDKRHEFLGLIDAECNNLQSMISEILDSSLIDVGQLAIELQPVRLQHLAHEVAEEMQHRTDVHHLVIDFPHRSFRGDGRTPGGPPVALSLQLRCRIDNQRGGSIIFDVRRSTASWLLASNKALLSPGFIRLADQSLWREGAAWSIRAL